MRATEVLSRGQLVAIGAGRCGSTSKLRRIRGMRAWPEDTTARPVCSATVHIMLCAGTHVVGKTASRFRKFSGGEGDMRINSRGRVVTVVRCRGGAIRGRVFASARCVRRRE